MVDVIPKYAVVEFTDTREVAVARTEWIIIEPPNVLEELQVATMRWPINKRNKGAADRIYTIQILKLGDDEAKLEKAVETYINTSDDDSEELGRGKREKFQKRHDSPNNSDNESKGTESKVAVGGGKGSTVKESKLAAAKDLMNKVKSQTMTDSESDRADETKRKVEELIAENKKLKLEKKTLEAALFALSSLPATVQTLRNLLEETRGTCSNSCHSSPSPLSLSRSSSGHFSYIGHGLSSSPVHFSSPAHSSSEYSSCGQINNSSPTSVVGDGSLTKEYLDLAERDPVTDKENQHGWKAVSAEQISRCSHTNAQKFVNDLLDAMHSREYLAGRSLTGGNSSKGESSKDALDKDDVIFIIDTTRKVFPDRKDTDIRACIRVKLNNVAKLPKQKSIP